MAVETNWLRSLLGQRIFSEGVEILPTTKILNFIGAQAEHNATTGATDVYLDGGKDWKGSVRVATTAALSATRVGNTLTMLANGDINGSGIDGITDLVVDNRILIKDQAAGEDNGLYVLSDLGSANSPAVFTRARLADETGEMTAGLMVKIEEGATYQGQLWQLDTINPIVLNSTPLVFSEFSSGGGGGADIIEVQVFS